MRLTVTEKSTSCEIIAGCGLLRRPELFSGIGRAAVITEDTVAPLYLDRLLDTLRQAGAAAAAMVLPAGEGIKSTKGLFEIYDGLLERGVCRGDWIITLGGGTVGDGVGFAAATFMRGVRLIHCPTTLLSQVDSSIGGKTAINHSKHKNLIGAFYQPELVVADTDTLATLPKKHFASGMAEVIKYAFIKDIALLENIRDIPYTVNRCAEIKTEYVQADPMDRGIRRELNFGHTLGHAIEAHGDFLLPHGFCVAMGMSAMAEIGEQLGVTQRGTAAMLRAALREAGLPNELPGIPQEELRRLLAGDKKNEGEYVNAVFLAQPGEAQIHAVKTGELCRLAEGLMK